MEQNKLGMLALCATPIGNLEDITLRVLRTLREADEVWAEDTRRTLGLLTHYDIKQRLVSCHEHNERERTEQLLAAIRSGRVIAYCSDAGMPGISDPGERLAAACAEQGLPVSVLPGASAVLTAAVLSGLPCAAFSFFGFLPRDKKERRKRMQRLCAAEELILLYESPQRLPDTLKELARELGGERPAAVLRELTKLHEEAARGTLDALAQRFAEPPRGECVVAIAGRENEPRRVEEKQVDEALKKLLAQGFSTKQAAVAVATVLDVQKNVAYERALNASKC